MRKLKFAKSKLKIWNKAVFGDLKERKLAIILDIERIDLLKLEGSITQDIFALMSLRKKELGDVLLKEEIHWRQSSRTKWIKEGDRNSKFFHRVAKMEGGKRNSLRWRLFFDLMLKLNSFQH